MASFEQSGKKKLWSVRFRIIENGQVVNKRLSGFKTKKEANTAYLEYEKNHIDYQKKIEENKNRILFSNLYQIFLDNARAKLKDSSLYDVTNIFETHILPTFSDKYMQDIKPIDILNWQNALPQNLSHIYRSRIRRHLNSIFNFAEKYYDLPNPSRKVEGLRNKEPKKEMLFWTKDEFLQFINAIDDNEVYKLFFTVLYVSGCRRGEVLALGVDDIDTEKSTIKISKSITNKGADNWNVVTPKNVSSNRTIYMPRDILEKMISLHKQYGGQFIFKGDNPLAHSTIDRYLKIYCQKAGVKKIRLHDLRHSCASLLISDGVSIVAVSKRLGHSNIEQTLNTYSHMMPSDNELMIRSVDAIKF